jgi:hypothetical protein
VNQDMAKKLRDPFKPEQIGHLPKAGITLDYVGHAATTDRLLQADHSWTWEPMGRNQDGSPVITVDKAMFSDQQAKVGLWINLLIGDTSTPGFGEGKNLKEAIGDAIRNAAMRRGVALDLWSKEDLNTEQAPKPKPEPKPAAPPAPTADPVTDALVKRVLELAKEFGSNVVTIQKSINENRAKNEGYLKRHQEWLERQIKTLEANIANKKAQEDSKFKIPPGAADDQKAAA